MAMTFDQAARRKALNYQQVAELKARGWIDGMSAFHAFGSVGVEAIDPVAGAREQYIAGTITVEAFEAKLDLAFGLRS